MLPAPTSSPSFTLPPAEAGERLHVALVCDWYLPRIGGIERQLAALAAALVSGGHRATVVTPMPNAQTGDRVALRRIHTTLLPGAAIMWSPRGFRAIGEALRTGDFDVVHVHCSTISPAAFAAIYEAQKLCLPTVATMHSIPGRFGHVFGWLHRRFGWGAWPVIYSGVSHRVARELRPFVARPLAILPNAIDARWWRPKAMKAATRDIAIACVMRLVPRKRGDVLLDAYRAVRAAMPGRRITLDFVGDGPSRRSLESRARAWGFRDEVRFHGSLEPTAIRAVLAAADIFALPCPIEAFGIAALEARAMGLPVLAMQGTGVSEFITDGTDGLLAENQAGFADSLRLLCADDALRRRLAHHNCTVPVSCTWEHSLTRHLAAYAEARQLVPGRGVSHR